MPKDIDIDEEVTEAKSGFDLKARLQGRALRTATIELFLDEVLGEKHLDNEQKLEAYKLIVAASETEGLELNDQMKATLATSKKEITRLTREQTKLADELHKTSLTLELRAAPRIVKEAATRAAYKASGAKPGDIAAKQIIPFNQAYAAYVIAHMVMGYTDNQSGERVNSLSVEDANNLREFLPDAEYARLEATVADLQDRNMISEAVTASADFSQAG
jgi:hypothetical protein